MSKIKQDNAYATEHREPESYFLLTNEHVNGRKTKRVVGLVGVAVLVGFVLFVAGDYLTAREDKIYTTKQQLELVRPRMRRQTQNTTISWPPVVDPCAFSEAAKRAGIVNLKYNFTGGIL